MPKRTIKSVGGEVDAVKESSMSVAHTSSKKKKSQERSTKSRSGTKEIHFDPPSNWEEELQLIEEMRKKRDAPVDTLGSEALPQGNRGEKQYRYECLISVMLSSQTKDAITAQAVRKLREYGMTAEHIAESKPEVLEELIKPAGFYKRKADYLIRTSRILLDKYDGDVPKTIEELIALPGVGYKMGYIALRNAWDICDGIGVDVHVHDICNRLHWTQSRNPDETRLQLQSWLPKKYWRDINLLLVGFGQQICSSPNPKCQECLLRDMCPSARRLGKGKKSSTSNKEKVENTDGSEDIEDLSLNLTDEESDPSEDVEVFAKSIERFKGKGKK